ncbi:MAG: hypothetical protein GY725_00580 [bacterium]|nr:hypothetical protein [bacterium]
MRTLVSLLFVSAFALVVQGPAHGQDKTSPGAEKNTGEAAARLGFEIARNSPLEIKSKELELMPDQGGQRRVVFKGGVRATQADMSLSCDWAEAVYQKTGSGQPDRITAGGNVRIVQGANTALCHKAVLDNLACTALCKGGMARAVLQRGDDVVEADEIFFDLCEGLVRASGGATVRVKGETASE